MPVCRMGFISADEVVILPVNHPSTGTESFTGPPREVLAGKGAAVMPPPPPRRQVRDLCQAIWPYGAHAAWLGIVL